ALSWPFSFWRATSRCPPLFFYITRPGHETPSFLWNSVSLMGDPFIAPRSWLQIQYPWGGQLFNHRSVAGESWLQPRVMRRNHAKSRHSETENSVSPLVSGRPPAKRYGR